MLPERPQSSEFELEMADLIVIVPQPIFFKYMIFDMRDSSNGPYSHMVSWRDSVRDDDVPDIAHIIMQNAKREDGSIDPEFKEYIENRAIDTVQATNYRIHHPKNISIIVGENRDDKIVLPDESNVIRRLKKNFSSEFIDESFHALFAENYVELEKELLRPKGPESFFKTVYRK